MAALAAAAFSSALRASQPPFAGAGDRLLIVDCLLPAQVRKLGSHLTYLAARRAIKASAAECEVRGGEYVAHDRANLRTALAVWMEQAKGGDASAQTYVGEIYEKGLGVQPDYGQAAQWYRAAAEKGFARAQANLGFLFEKGLGVPKDLAEALRWYRRASGLPDAPPVEPVRPQPQAPAAPPLNGTSTGGAAGPSLQIIDPPVTPMRGNPTATVRSGMTVLPVIGKVTAPGGLLSLTVNDQKETPDRNGLFRTDIPVLGQDTPVKIVAVDRAGARSQMDFVLVPEVGAGEGIASAPRSLSLAAPRRFYALLTGNDHHQKLPKLETAVADVRAVADVLANKYGFQVTVLTNASRYDILSKLNEFREKLGENDSFLLYYAGHGELDRVNLRGHWLPVDAEPNNPANWISNVAITDMLNAMKARQAIVVADSCYAGAMTRTAFDQPPPGSRKAIWRSRTVLSSGGLKPVMDGGGGKHSVFAAAFLQALRAAQGPVDGLNLFQRIAGQVVHGAMKEGVEQVPEYAPIRFAGHEAGDFLFVPKRV